MWKLSDDTIFDSNTVTEYRVDSGLCVVIEQTGPEDSRKMMYLERKTSRALWRHLLIACGMRNAKAEAECKEIWGDK